MANSKFDRYGKVFIRRQESFESENATPYKLLAGAKFSNLQLDVVLDKDITDKSFYGKRYSVGVLGHHLNVPTPFGMAELIDEDLLECAFQLLINYYVEYGVLSRSNQEKYSAACNTIRASGIHLWAVLSAAGKHRKDLNLCNSFYGLVVVDDALEAAAEQDRKQATTQKSNQISYSCISQLAFGIVKVCRSETQEIRENVFEKFECLAKTGSKSEKYTLRAVAVHFKDAVESGERYGCSPKFMLDEIASFFEYGVLECSSEWKLDVMGNADKAALMIPVMARLGELVGGGSWALEVFLLQNGIQLDDDLRQCGLFRTIKAFTALQVRAVNDFFSFEKEMHSEGNEWRSNVGCLLHKFKGFTVEEAMSKLARDANEILEQIHVLCDLLLDTWKGDKHEQAKQFVQQVYHTITVGIQGHALLGRYHKNLTMDCYIDN